MGETGAVTTYAELDAGANRLSQLLHAAGLRPGDHIAICMENHPRYLEVVWGCHYAGLVYTACSSRLTHAELAYIVNDCAARAFITSRTKAEQAAEILPETPDVELRLMLDGVIEGYQSYEDAVARQPAEPLPDRVAGTDMLYSSGTTGRPKGVKGATPDKPLGAGPVLRRRVAGGALRGRRRRHLPVARPAVPRRAAPVLPRHPRARGHGRRHGALRPRAGLGAHRALPRHPQPVGADHVRADAEAAGRGAGAVRPELAEGRGACGRAVPRCRSSRR